MVGVINLGQQRLQMGESAWGLGAANQDQRQVGLTDRLAQGRGVALGIDPPHEDLGLTAEPLEQPAHIRGPALGAIQVVAFD